MKIIWKFRTEDWVVTVWSMGVRGHYRVKRIADGEEWYGERYSPMGAFLDAMEITGLKEVPDDQETLLIK